MHFLHFLSFFLSFFLSCASCIFFVLLFIVCSLFDVPVAWDHLSKSIKHPSPSSHSARKTRMLLHWFITPAQYLSFKRLLHTFSADFIVPSPWWSTPPPPPTAWSLSGYPGGRLCLCHQALQGSWCSNTWTEDKAYTKDYITVIFELKSHWGLHLFNFTPISFW